MIFATSNMPTSNTHYWNALMKCKLLRDELITHPDLKSFDDIKKLAELVHTGKISADEYDRRSRVTVKAGTVIDHPYAWQLVAMGMAEPYDQECKNRAESAMPGSIPLELKIEAAVAGLQRTEDAQVIGDPAHDATPEQVEIMRAVREKRLARSSG